MKGCQGPSRSSSREPAREHRLSVQVGVRPYDALLVCATLNQGASESQGHSRLGVCIPGDDSEPPACAYLGRAASSALFAADAVLIAKCRFCYGHTRKMVHGSNAATAKCVLVPPLQRTYSPRAPPPPASRNKGGGGLPPGGLVLGLERRCRGPWSFLRVCASGDATLNALAE